MAVDRRRVPDPSPDRSAPLVFPEAACCESDLSRARILDSKLVASVMAYIVDGNNVMGQMPGWHRDRSKSRRKLLEMLAGFAKVKGARVTVVFDGGPDPVVPEGSSFRGVKVLYAERGSDADTRIERLVDSSPNPRGLTVVTSDRHLAFLVRSRGATVIRSGEFRSEVERLLESMPRAADGEEFEIGDINAWLRYFGSVPQDDDDTEG